MKKRKYGPHFRLRVVSEKVPLASIEKIFKEECGVGSWSIGDEGNVIVKMINKIEKHPDSRFQLTFDINIDECLDLDLVKLVKTHSKMIQKMRKVDASVDVNFSIDILSESRLNLTLSPNLMMEMGRLGASFTYFRI